MDPLPLLQDLVAIPSVNPMGRFASDAEPYESGVSDYLEAQFRRISVPHERHEIAPKRANLVARVDVPGATRTIVLDAHQDTVPVDGMTIDPFDPVVRDGRLFGRGACDVKGGMAAMLAAFCRLWETRRPGAANVVLTCCCDEESTSLGVNALVQSWQGGLQQSALLGSRPDVAIVAEPTELDVVVAHRGATRWKIRTTGRACHSSDPTQGINAIYRMARVVACLEEYASELPRRSPPHPLCGPATLSVGVIAGGVSVNTVPDVCTVEIDRRVIPGEDGQAVMGHVEQYLRERLDVPFDMLPPWIIGPPLPDTDNGALADELLRTVAEVVGPRQKLGVPYGTHASRFAVSGVPAVVFGPGSIAQAHTRDEWISVEQLRQAAEIYYRFCSSPD
jgi:acetylornithine deacetylase